MATVDFVTGADISSTSTADDADPSVTADECDLSSTKILLREALRREASLRRERDQLLEQGRMLTKLFAGREDAAFRVARLTSRQQQIMALVLLGHQNKRIAAEIGVSQRTVESHRASIMKKTGSNCLPELARLAFVARRWTEELDDQVESSASGRPLTISGS